nr:hypothetical protein CFP56_33527 [Quercus suber]
MDLSDEGAMSAAWRKTNSPTCIRTQVIPRDKWIASRMCEKRRGYVCIGNMIEGVVELNALCNPALESTCASVDLVNLLCDLSQASRGYTFLLLHKISSTYFYTPAKSSHSESRSASSQYKYGCRLPPITAAVFEYPATMLLPERQLRPFAGMFKESTNQILDRSSYDGNDSNPAPTLSALYHPSKPSALSSKPQSWSYPQHYSSSIPALLRSVTETPCLVPSPFPLSYLRDNSSISTQFPPSCLAFSCKAGENHADGECSELRSTLEPSHHASILVPCASVPIGPEVQFGPIATGHAVMALGCPTGQQSCGRADTDSPTQTPRNSIHATHGRSTSHDTTLRPMCSRGQDCEHSCAPKVPDTPTTPASLCPGRTPNFLIAQPLTSQSHAALTSSLSCSSVGTVRSSSPQTTHLQAPDDFGSIRSRDLQSGETNHGVVTAGSVQGSFLSEPIETRDCIVPSDSTISNLSKNASTRFHASQHIAPATDAVATKKRPPKAPAPLCRPSKHVRVMTSLQSQASKAQDVVLQGTTRTIGVIDTLTMACIASYSRPGENLDWTVEKNKAKRREMQNTIKKRKQRESTLLKKGLTNSGGQYPGAEGVRAYLNRTENAQSQQRDGHDDTTHATGSVDNWRVDHLSEEKSAFLTNTEISVGCGVTTVDVKNHADVKQLETDGGHGIDDVVFETTDEGNMIAPEENWEPGIPEVSHTSSEELMELDFGKAMQTNQVDDHEQYHQAQDDGNDHSGACLETDESIGNVEQCLFVYETEKSNNDNSVGQNREGMVASEPHYVTDEDEDCPASSCSPQMPHNEETRFKVSASEGDVSDTDSTLRTKLEDVLLRGEDIRLQLASRRSKSDRAPIHDFVGDRAFVERLKPVLKTSSIRDLKTWMSWSCARVLGLLEIAQPPNNDEALFLSGQDATEQLRQGRRVECPFLTEDQQSLQLHNLDDFFNEHYDDDAEVFVQVSSVTMNNRDLCQKKKMSEVKDHFAQPTGQCPWNLLELASHIEDGVRPQFLNQEDCRLLTKIKFPGKKSTARNGYLPGWKEVEKWVLVAEAGAVTGPHQDSHGFNTYITVQQGFVGFGWLSNPSLEERAAWVADTDHFTGGRWRYVILKPGQTIAFPSGTVHFVFRSPDGSHTLAFGGHYLRCSQIVSWVQMMLEEQVNSGVSNEDLTVSAPEYLKKVEKFVRAANRQGKEGLWGGPEAIVKFLKLKDEFLSRNKERHARAQARGNCQ